MAYTPTVWETGDIITAEKLNKAEQGIAAATLAADVLMPFDVLVDDGTYTSSKTFAELYAAMQSGKIPVAFIKFESGDDVFLTDMAYAAHIGGIAGPEFILFSSLTHSDSSPYWLPKCYMCNAEGFNVLPSA